ncbi:F-box/kelch-repeat protein At5g60570-like [Malania oleifera]|uniref:F-box/kelch-repeat protein At5g60570-like n=1 Tax=Malania oleifera TaxID=397392 RepID=UPI0025AE2FCE|nr:F-box/kelch-repeat protein At5g60570-like [Malania oleifera]
MVFRHSLEELKTMMEVLGCELPAMVDVQGYMMLELYGYLNQERKYINKHWQSCFYVLFSGKTLEEFMKGLSGKAIYGPNLDHIGLKKRKYEAMSQSGGNHDGQASDDSLLPGLHDDSALDILAWSCRSDYANLACLNKKFKSLMASGYLYKLRRQLGVIEHWVYLACILMPWESYDPMRQRWMRLPRMPCDECFTYADKESLAVGTELLVFGRELSGFAIWMYSLLTRDWSRCPLMNLPRCLFGSSSRGEIAIVAGGSDKNGRILKSAELFNSEFGTWQTLPDMNLPRKLCSGFFMDEKFYIIGGISSDMKSLSCGEEYNLETQTWKRIKNMYPGSHVGREPAMGSPPLVAVVNNQLYSADQATNEVKKYDKANNSWSVVMRLPVRADSSNGWGLAFKACGNSILVIGGHRGPEGEVIVLHSWQPEGGQQWNVLSVRERAGAFVYNCAVMGC